MVAHSPDEWLDVLYRCWMNKFAIVKPQTNPEVIHEDRETCHDGNDTPWATKLIATGKRDEAVNIKITAEHTCHVCLNAGQLLCHYL